MFRHSEQSALAEKFRLAENRGASQEAESSEDLQLKVTDLMKQLDQREEALKQAHISMDTLTAELEELDGQNQEATQVCFALCSDVPHPVLCTPRTSWIT